LLQLNLAKNMFYFLVGWGFRNKSPRSPQMSMFATDVHVRHRSPWFFHAGKNMYIKRGLLGLWNVIINYQMEWDSNLRSGRKKFK
jgi:hypothetical protein